MRWSRARPDRYTANPFKKTRDGKIFVDYLRNQRGGSAIVNYSTRAKKGAPVACPLRWDELKGLKAAAPYTVKTLPARLKALKRDPWEGFFSTRQSITAKARKALGLQLEFRHDQRREEDRTNDYALRRHRRQNSAWCLIADACDRVRLGGCGRRPGWSSRGGRGAAGGNADRAAKSRLGSDDKIHLAYEIVLMNMAPSAVSLEKIEALDAESGAVIGTLDGDGLAQDGAAEWRRQRNRACRRRLRLRVHGRDAGEGGRAAEGAAASLRDRRGEGPGREAQRRSRPGAGAAGADDVRHRSAAGRARRRRHRAAAQRFALGDRRRMLHALQLPSRRHAPDQRRGARRRALRHRFRAAERQEHADTRARWSSCRAMPISATRSMPSPTARWWKPRTACPSRFLASFPTDATIQMAAGNHVVVDIGEGRFAFYAHMQPGSVRVKVGDKVKTGQVLGLLGNSGNTDSPHLHFHVMDGPSPLVSNGLPFAFNSLHRAGAPHRRATSVHGRRGDDREGRSFGATRERTPSPGSGGEFPVSAERLAIDAAQGEDRSGRKEQRDDQMDARPDILSFAAARRQSAGRDARLCRGVRAEARCSRLASPWSMSIPPRRAIRRSSAASTCRMSATSCTITAGTRAAHVFARTRRIRTPSGAISWCRACARRASTSSTPSPIREAEHRAGDRAGGADRGHRLLAAAHRALRARRHLCLRARQREGRGAGWRFPDGPRDVRRARPLGGRARAAASRLRRLVASRLRHAGDERMGHARTRSRTG